MQIQPPIRLSDFIKHYLLIRSEEMCTKKLRSFSDGNTGIVFSLNNQLVLKNETNNATVRLPFSFLYGQITTFKDIQLHYETSLIVVVFQPAGINNLLGLPAHGLRDLIVGAQDIFGNQGLKLEEKLFENDAVPEKIGLLNNFFIELAVRKKHKTELLIPAAINFISRSNGLTSLNQLVKFTGYTERQIERKFMGAIGIPPKKFINVIKLPSYLKLLNANTTIDESLTQIAYDAGYADQSHLIKEFKKHTGMTPGLYRDKAHKVAVNFVTSSFCTNVGFVQFPEKPVSYFCSNLNIIDYG